MARIQPLGNRTPFIMCKIKAEEKLDLHFGFYFYERPGETLLKVF